MDGYILVTLVDVTKKDFSASLAASKVQCVIAKSSA